MPLGKGHGARPDPGPAAPGRDSIDDVDRVVGDEPAAVGQAQDRIGIADAGGEDRPFPLRRDPPDDAVAVRAVLKGVGRAEISRQYVARADSGLAEMTVDLGQPPHRAVRPRLPDGIVGADEQAGLRR